MSQSRQSRGRKACEIPLEEIRWVFDMPELNLPRDRLELRASSAADPLDVSLSVDQNSTYDVPQSPLLGTPSPEPVQNLYDVPA